MPDDDWEMFEPAEEAEPVDDTPPPAPARRGPPGEWGGSPRRALVAVLALIAAGAVVAAVAGTGETPPTRTIRRTVAALPKLQTVGVPPGTPFANADAVVEKLARRGSRVYCGVAGTKQIALTFDDGPGPQTIPILRILTKTGVPATFFLIGRNVQSLPKLAALYESLGMAVGSHTQTHPDLTKIPTDQIAGQLGDGKAAVVAATGKPVTLFRPPYGARNRHIDAQARRLGLLEVLWDVDTRDSDHALPATILANARRGLRPGSIILMHEDATTVSVLPKILASMTKRGLQPVTVPQLVSGGHRTKTCPYIPATG